MSPINLNKPDGGLGSRYMNYGKDDWRFRQFHKLNKGAGPISYNAASLRGAAAKEIAHQNATVMGTDIFKTTGKARQAFKTGNWWAKTKGVGRVGLSGLGIGFGAHAAYTGYKQDGAVGAVGGYAGFAASTQAFSTGLAMFGVRKAGIGAMAQVFGAGVAAPVTAIAAVAIGAHKIHNMGRDARKKMEFGEELIDNPMTASMRNQAFSSMMQTRGHVSQAIRGSSHGRDRIVDSLGDEASYMHL